MASARAAAAVIAIAAAATGACNRRAVAPVAAPAAAAVPAPAPVREDPGVSPTLAAAAAALPEIGRPYVSEPLVAADDFVRRRYRRGDTTTALGEDGLRPSEPVAGGHGNPPRVPVTIEVTIAPRPETDDEHARWVAEASAYPQVAVAGVPAALTSGFYSCAGDGGAGTACDIHLQLRAGYHVEVMGGGRATRAELDALLAELPLAALAGARAPDAVTVTRGDFHGRAALVLRGRAAEVVVVPEIGRVMRFDLVDEHGGVVSGPLWQNPAFDAGGPAPDDGGWTNYGGDKAWPAPQSEWPKHNDVVGAGWPPPKTFDAAPFTGNIRGGAEPGVELVSEVDRSYGMRIRRFISLHARKPVMTIETRYEKVTGAPVRLGVWTITQLAAPDGLAMFMLLPARPTTPGGYRRIMPAAPDKLTVAGRILSLGRDRHEKTMIGSEARALLWVGDALSLRIEDAAAGARGESGTIDAAQIYTDPSPAPAGYVELELLGRIGDVGVGRTATATVTYTLARRTQADAAAEARAQLAQ